MLYFDDLNFVIKKKKGKNEKKTKNKLFVESAFTGADPGAIYEAGGISALMTP